MSGPSTRRLSTARRLVQVLVLGSLGAGLLVRLIAGWHACFADDESLFWSMGVQLARGEAFPLVGPPVSGSPAGVPGPLYYWLCALPALFTSHPYASTVLYALLNQLGVAAFAWVIARWWSLRAALFFLVISIGSVWITCYADRIWPGNLFFPLCALVVWLVARIVDRPSRRAEPFALAMLSVVMPQIHLSTVHLVLAAVVVLALRRTKPSFKWLAIGVAAGLLLYVPYVVNEVRTDLGNTKALLAHASSVPHRSLKALISLYLSFLGLGTTDGAYLFARGYWYAFNHQDYWTNGGVDTMNGIYERAGGRPFLWLMHVASWLAQAVGAVVLVVRAIRRRELRLPEAFLLVGFVDITALYLISGKSGYVHYTTIVAPLAFLPVVGLSELLRRRWWRRATWVFAVATVLAGVLVSHAYYAGMEGTIADQIALVRRIDHEREGRPYRLAGASQWLFPSAWERLARHHLRVEWAPGQSADPRDTFVIFNRPDWQQNPGLVVIEEWDHLVLARPATGPR